MKNVCVKCKKHPVKFYYGKIRRKGKWIRAGWCSIKCLSTFHGHIFYANSK